ncbi:uncharacterized protein LOC119067230 [Bradysia coprophila]|uniref:uncharacterized protein LOC119067230 n=1 Tax=Bradysia coprophila TaxID=38358 RepID=UPI00187DA312|nr:uncharacterized protein LOC119067230 [Bradysia coprophila]
MTTQNIRNYLSQSVSGDDIQLDITELDLNTTEIVISNLNFKTNRSTGIKLLSLSALLLGGSLIFQSIILYAALIVFLSIRFYCFTCLVQSEKLTVTKDFGVQLLTTYTLGRTRSLFIQFAHIHDVVIQEVIQNLKVTFMLAFLTKGSWFEKRPIIPIVNTINPRLDVLKIVYNILRKYVGRS